MPALRKDEIVIEEDDDWRQNDFPINEYADNEGNDEADVFDFPAPEPKRRVVRKKKLTSVQKKEKKKEKSNLLLVGLVKPDVTTDKEHERFLRRIATKGVVQLFNAVAGRQKNVSQELSKKMSMKERKEAIRKLRGSQFDVNGRPKEKKEIESEEEDDDENMDELDLKDENDD